MTIFACNVIGSVKITNEPSSKYLQNYLVFGFFVSDPITWTSSLIYNNRIFLSNDPICRPRFVLMQLWNGDAFHSSKHVQDFDFHDDWTGHVLGALSYLYVELCFVQSSSRLVHLPYHRSSPPNLSGFDMKSSWLRSGILQVKRHVKSDSYGAGRCSACWGRPCAHPIHHHVATHNPRPWRASQPYTDFRWASWVDWGRSIFHRSLDRINESVNGILAQNACLV